MKLPLPRQVVCAAIRHKGGRIICGPRHHHCIRLAHDLGIYSNEWEQGFVDQKNEFMTREEAMELAKERGQVQRYSIGEHQTALYSEDLY